MRCSINLLSWHTDSLRRSGGNVR